MLSKWNRRRYVQRRWEQAILMLTNKPAIDDLTDKDREVLRASLVATMTLYNNRTGMTKQTIRLLFLLKRVLADKRLYDDIKVLEYLMLTHTIYKKRWMNKEVKERLMAHNLQMAQLYLEAIRHKQKTNPFAPGQLLQGDDIE